MPAVTVIVPTLNEAGNIQPLVDRLAAAFGHRTDWDVLFVDDDSSDGTGTEIRKAAARHPVDVIVREGERGLASAVLRGIESTSSPVVVVMDADLSHPPDVAPKLAEAVEGGAEVAIGSRYVPGGGTEGWSRVRLFLSRGAALLNRGLTSARDSNAGFFAIRRSLIAGTGLRVEGFKILLEILAKVRPKTVVEVPIRFAPRHAGKSKVAAGTAIAYLKQLFRLYAIRPAAQVVALIAFLFVLKVVGGALTELDSIEAYHWLYAQNPALGYYDHPAMIGWLVWLSTTIFGHSPLGVRMVTFIGSSLAIWLVFLTGRRLYDERAGRLAALLFGVAFGTLKFASMATPDAPLLWFWIATVWALGHAIAGDRPAWWLAAGLFLGCAMLSKYTAIFLPFGILLFLMGTREHSVWFRRKEPYLAALIALVVFSPTIVWNAQNEWQSLVYQGVGRVSDVRGFTTKYARQMAVSQLWLLTPVAAIWAWGAGLAALARWRSRPWADRLVASTAMPILLFFHGDRALPVRAAALVARRRRDALSPRGAVGRAAAGSGSGCIMDDRIGSPGHAAVDRMGARPVPEHPPWMVQTVAARRRDEGGLYDRAGLPRRRPRGLPPAAEAGGRFHVGRHRREVLRQLVERSRPRGARRGDRVGEVRVPGGDRARHRPLSGSGAAGRGDRAALEFGRETFVLIRARGTARRVRARPAPSGRP
jgi:glycosyltransferase involved in cell wall biosynthesis